MSAKLSCTRCQGPMVKGRTKGVFSGERPDGMAGITQTVKYMCKDCGYIEERAINAQHLVKSFNYICMKE